MRNKTKASSLWNATALPKAIKNIVLVYNSAKSTYDNADAFTFLFGTDATVAAGTVKLSTVSGQATYTVTPDAETYTFFKMTLNLSYSFYWDSITINYVDGTSEPVNPPHEHTEEVLPAKEATCTETGLTEGKKCSVCGEVLVKQEEVAAKGHTEEVLAAKEATCTETGLTEGKKCSVCEEVLVKQEEVAAKGHSFAEGKCTVCGADDPDYVAPETPAEPKVLVTFEFGANGTASHSDGSDLGTSKDYTEGDYTLALTGLYKVYGPARDAQGNSCIKLGTGSVAAKLSFTVPAEVNEVVILVAKYKSNTANVKINETTYTLTKNSNDGQYDEIKIDTTTTKTVSLETLSGGYRCMINSIAWVGAAAEPEQPEAPKFATHEAIVAEFLKDFNTFSSQEYTTVAAYWADGTKTNFWKDSAMHAKWSWMFKYLVTLASAQGQSTDYLNNMNADPISVSGYATQNVAIFLLQINNDTWNTEYKETYGGLSSKWTTVDCTAVTFEAYSSYLPAEYFG